jgi:putative transposase
MREAFHALLYVLNTGCPWRFPAKEFPPRSTVHGYFRRWQRDGQRDGDWPRLRHALVGLLREKLGREPSPSAAVLDSQSVRSGPKGGAESIRSASMPARRSRAAKRHLLTDTLGLPLAVVVHSAAVQDRDGAALLLTRLRRLFPWIEVIWADAAYRGPKLAAAGARAGRWRLEIVERQPGARGFQVQPRRWVIERTFGWLSRNRRLARDFESLCASAVAFVELASLQLLLRRLARA